MATSLLEGHVQKKKELEGLLGNPQTRMLHSAAEQVRHVELEMPVSTSATAENVAPSATVPSKWWPWRQIALLWRLQSTPGVEQAVEPPQ
jgi:hypothetical protein